MKIEQPAVGDTNNNYQDPSLDKIKTLMQSKQREIFSADGSAISVMLITRGTMLREEMVQYLAADALESGNISADKMEEEKAKINATINNLIQNGVVVEENGTLRLAL